MRCSLITCIKWRPGNVCYFIRRVQLAQQELLTLPEHTSSPPVFSGVRVTRSLVLYVCFVDPCLSFCTVSFGHCVVCSSSTYGFWFPLWYLQTLPICSIGLYKLLSLLYACKLSEFNMIHKIKPDKWNLMTTMKYLRGS
jgi:hypothetical protein